MEWLIYIAIGLFSGFLAGLFGIGGGLIIIPMLHYILLLQQVNADLIMHIAVATSLAIIFFTSISAVIVQTSYASIDWSIFIWMSLGIGIGSSISAIFTSHIPSKILQLSIGYFSLAIAAYLLITSLKPMPVLEQNGGKKTTKLNLVMGGLVIGYVSAMFGIGGGLLITPYLNWYRVPIKTTVGTSSACTLAVSFIGTVGYAISGWQIRYLPTGSLGYIYLPALVAIVIFSIPSARLGVKLAHRLPPKNLQQAFAYLLITVGLLFIVQ